MVYVSDELLSLSDCEKTVICDIYDVIASIDYVIDGLDSFDLESAIITIMTLLSALAGMYNISVSEVLDINFEKLSKRFPEGFNANKSVNRKED